MEIERKWMVSGWPEVPFPLLKEHRMKQGYLVVRPTVRIREEALAGGETSHILCFKSGRGLAREELEIRISPEEFEGIRDMIGLPLILKTRRTYALPGGLELEVNHVDEGLKTEFWYAEIEFDSIEEANAFDPAGCGLSDYLSDDVTEDPSQTMGAYWLHTRCGD